MDLQRRNKTLDFDGIENCPPMIGYLAAVWIVLGIRQVPDQPERLIEETDPHSPPLGSKVCSAAIRIEAVFREPSSVGTSPNVLLAPETFFWPAVRGCLREHLRLRKSQR